MKLAVIFTLTASLLGCAPHRTMKQGQSFEFRGVEVTEDGRHLCNHAVVMIDGKSGRQYVQCNPR